MQGFDYQKLFLRMRYPVAMLLAGGILVLAGIFFTKSGLSSGGTKVEVLPSGVEKYNPDSITVEISGQILTPGVYKLQNGSRIDDLLVLAGGFSVDADREWCSKYLNRAAKLSDSQKIFIPSKTEQLIENNLMININSASLEKLDTLPGIGQVYGQSIIEHRPYSTTSELVSKGVIKQSGYDKIKDLISVY